MAKASADGVEWRPSDASAEIQRILSESNNYYMVLHVTPSADVSEIKRNYKRLSLLLHPDRCTLERAKDAFQEVNIAHTTLTNPVKRKMYDLYLGDRLQGTGATETYTEWEARMAQGPVVRIPGWLLFILRLPIVGLVVAILLVVLLIPLLLVLLVIMFILAVVCFPCGLLSFSRKQQETTDEESGAVTDSQPTPQ
jgi:DnaJ-domain-containing protein 1